MTSLRINGKPVKAKPGITLLELAQKQGIEIPTLCHHPALTPKGSCRLCLVEDETTGELFTSCNTYVTGGMSILTDSQRVKQARKEILELIFAQHPVDCTVCDSANYCKLRRYAADAGVQGNELPGRGEFLPVFDNNPLIHRDYSKCIGCGICVRACREIQGAGAVEFKGSGWSYRPTSSFNKTMDGSSCELCGLCVSLCPVGALIEKPPLHRGVEDKRVRTVCPYCGCGCNLELRIAGGKVIGVRADIPGSWNGPSLCAKGRYGLFFVNHPDRLTQPLRREGEDLTEISWEEAIKEIAGKIKEIIKESGPSAVGILASAKTTNEENYLIQKFARAAIGTNNVDHCARLCHSPTVAGLAGAFGSAAMTNSIGDIEEAEVILVTGSNTTVNHPVIAQAIKRAVLHRGARLLIIDPRELPLSRYATIHLKPRPGTDVAWLNSMAQTIVEESLHNKKFIQERTEGFESLVETLKKYPPEKTEKITGIPAEQLRQVARAYAQARRASIFYAMGITQHIRGTDNVRAIANLAMLCGHLGKPGTGINPLRGQNNVQGACDMGALPDFLPGYQRVDSKEAREKFRAVWGREVPSEPGLTVGEMMEATLEGKLRALLVFGENPMVTDAESSLVEDALKQLDLLVVQDIFPTETSAFAHYVLPGASFAEKEGTFTSTERRVQKLNKALEPPGTARTDGETIALLSAEMGYHIQHQPAEVMKEIATLVSTYGGIDYRRLDKGGIQWPCANPQHPGTPILHVESFPRGKGLFQPVDYQPPVESPDHKYPLILSTGRILYQYHSRTMSKRSPIDRMEPQGFLEINPTDAEKMGIRDGDAVKVSSRRGKIVSRARVSASAPAGVVFMSFHFADEAVNRLTSSARDPLAKIPEFKVSAVRVEKI